MYWSCLSSSHDPIRHVHVRHDRLVQLRVQKENPFPDYWLSYVPNWKIVLEILGQVSRKTLMEKS
ncbi:hypothetical protein J4E85_002541 [Alternaria conjuncta]|uniref:uncharacterized protein n=1 Tax=Alternaria conjuncta TaxID=181017 RepID=UPI00222082F5|nr:uncharacterized protein J4E85_002541 [Alternaria conjuncta]KAI4934683.1 hypothetical protein J4E85_002541 [Alternaria conjuncta]